MTANVAHIDTANFHPEAQPTRRHAYKGRRVRRGLVWHFIPDDTDAVYAERILTDVLGALTDQPMALVVTGTTCDDCGCLLTNPAELCPNCVRPWMYAQETAFNERKPVIYYRRREQVAA